MDSAPTSLIGGLSLDTSLNVQKYDVRLALLLAREKADGVVKVKFGNVFKWGVFIVKETMGAENVVHLIVVCLF